MWIYKNLYAHIHTLYTYTALTLCLQVRSALIMYFLLKIGRGYSSKANWITHSLKKEKSTEEGRETGNGGADQLLRGE